MTQKAIWKIVVLVSTALLGIFGMQVYSIISTFQLNSELFDGNVHNALDHIVSKLEQKEFFRIIPWLLLAYLVSFHKSLPS